MFRKLKSIYPALTPLSAVILVAISVTVFSYYYKKDAREAEQYVKQVIYEDGLYPYYIECSDSGGGSALCFEYAQARYREAMDECLKMDTNYDDCAWKLKVRADEMAKAKAVK